MSPYITQLEAAGIIEHCEPRPIHSWTKIFGLPEPSKTSVPPHRRDSRSKRSMALPRFPLHDTTPTCRYPKTRVGSLLVIGGGFALLLLSTRTRPGRPEFFGVQIGTQTFRLCRLPMGACISVFVGHTISERLHQRLLPEGIKRLTYIDNWYSQGNNTEGKQTRS